MKKETIAAISSAVGNGAIGIVRMSGPDCLDIALKFFRKKKQSEIKPRFLYLGDFVSESVNDQCLMVFFKAPHSFTGENMIEFQVHGGRFLCEQILKELVDAGARLAENGEFSKLAFVNGKLSLDKAEGIIDLIEAESQEEIKAGYNLVKGKLFQTVKQLQNKLLSEISFLEMTIDYPEHEDENQAKQATQKTLQEVKNATDKLLSQSKQGSMIKSGVNVALVGKTNVGKSSLLNSLLGEERAIVTDIEGTTRDSIKESYLFNGVKFNFIDTAGLRESIDPVEKIGIQKTKETMNSADIILFVIDSSKDISKDEQKLYDEIKHKQHIVVLNKSDLTPAKPLAFQNSVQVSCMLGEGIEKLKAEIYDLTMGKNFGSSHVLTNQRHIQALKDVKKQIEELGNIHALTTDIIAFKLRVMWTTLGKITGESENEKIIDEIFSRFCLGK